MGQTGWRIEFHPLSRLSLVSPLSLPRVFADEGVDTPRRGFRLRRRVFTRLFPLFSQAEHDPWKVDIHRPPEARRIRVARSERPGKRRPKKHYRPRTPRSGVRGRTGSEGAYSSVGFTHGYQYLTATRLFSFKTFLVLPP